MIEQSKRSRVDEDDGEKEDEGPEKRQEIVGYKKPTPLYRNTR